MSTVHIQQIYIIYTRVLLFATKRVVYSGLHCRLVKFKNTYKCLMKKLSYILMVKNKIIFKKFKIFKLNTSEFILLFI